VTESTLGWHRVTGRASQGLLRLCGLWVDWPPAPGIPPPETLWSAGGVQAELLPELGKGGACWSYCPRHLLDWVFSPSPSVGYRVEGTGFFRPGTGPPFLQLSTVAVVQEPAISSWFLWLYLLNSPISVPKFQPRRCVELSEPPAAVLLLPVSKSFSRISLPRPGVVHESRHDLRRSSEDCHDVTSCNWGLTW